MSTQKRSRVAAAGLLTAALFLHGCVAPDPGSRAAMRTPADLASAGSLAAAPDAVWPRAQWWTSYGDPALNALVEEALAGSPDVVRAQARIMQARGAAQAAGAALMPTIGAQGNSGFTKQSYNNGVPAAFVPRGWNSTGSLALAGDIDLDLWGRNRQALAAATSQAQAAQADARQAELMLAGNVVSSYFDLARLIARGDALDQAVQARSALAGLMRRRVDQGLESEAPLRRAEAEAAAARAALSANNEQILLRRHAIAALLGAGPDRGLAVAPRPIAAIPESGVPADAGIALAGRRPDVVAARLRVEAAAARIGVARAAYLPDISLRGLVGLTSLGLSNLIDSGSTYGNAGAAFTLPLFQGGRLAGDLRQARGGYDAAVADYNATVIGALREVADALASRDAAAVQETQAADAARASAGAYDIAMKRYQAGLTGYLDALAAQTAALSAREAAIDAQFRTLALDVALARALGGGFADTPVEKANDDE